VVFPVFSDTGEDRDSIMRHITGRRKSALLLALFLFMISPGIVFTKSALQYTDEGKNYLQRGDYRKAVISFRNALQKNQSHFEALIGIGEAYYRLEAPTEALRAYEQALRIKAASPEALTGIGFIMVEMGNSRRAIEYFNRALKVSRETLDAHYGLAWLYYSMDKMIWARRKAEYILGMSPLHFKTLLLMAHILSRDNDLEGARKYAWKAIDSQPEMTDGYIALSRIMFRDFTITENSDSRDEALKALQNALVINSSSPDANNLKGIMEWYGGRYNEAAGYFQKALEEKATAPFMYSLGISLDGAGKTDEALKSFLQALKLNPGDGILQSRLEQFMVLRDVKVGHPARTMFFRENFDTGKERMKQNLPDEAVLYLRRTLLLNPMSREARELLMGYYEALDYNRFYIDELKELQRLYPGISTRDRLTAAVYKRRDRMYHREGFAGDDIPRDVPRILVLDFQSDEGVSTHPDIGRVLAFDLTWALSQFGRQVPAPVRLREKVSGLAMTPAHFAGTLDRLEEMIKNKTLPPFEYLVYGSCSEQGDSTALKVKLMDFRTGVIMGESAMKESGRFALPRLSLRIARRLFAMVPFRGRVLKLKEKSIVVNLGLFDGLKKGEKLVINKINPGSKKYRISKRLIFTVTSIDTLVAEAVPLRRENLQLINSRDRVEVLKKRRARLLEE